MGMPGNILSIQPPNIITKTAGAPGASGGPLFIRKPYSAILCGVAISVKMFGNPAYPDRAENREETTSIMISLVKDILESDEMKNQYENRYIDETWIS